MGTTNDASVEELRQKLQDRLKKSGMDTVIKKLVENVLASKEDHCSIDPEEVLQTIYNRGLIDSVLKLDSCKSSTLANNENNNNEIKKQLRLEDSAFGTGWLEQLREHKEENGKERRRYLKIEILGAKAYLDHLSHDEGSACKSHKLILHLLYKTQRFQAQPVKCQSDPNFRDEFVIDIGHFSGSVAQMSQMTDPLRIVIIREDPNLPSGGGLAISFTLHDWRSVLLSDNGSEAFNLELMGTGLEHNVPIGLLNMKISILPCPQEQISESTFLTFTQSEKNRLEESLRFFVSYSKQWMDDFLSIRPAHVFRNVKLFAFDEKMVSRPIVTFVQPILNTDRVFLTPFHAAWFVALFSKVPSTSDTIPHLQSMELTILSKAGSSEDVSILLCSLLSGFGLHSFVAIGCGKGNANHSTSWVVTFDNYFKPTFWDSSSAKRFDNIFNEDASRIGSKTQIPSKFYNISCLFNNESMYANIQGTEAVHEIDWDIMNPTKWKCIPTKIITKVQDQTNTSHPLLLRPCTGLEFDVHLMTANMEIQIQEMIKEERTRKNLGTRWEETISKLMGQQLATMELRASTGGHHFDNFFEAVIMRSIKPGYDFKGFHRHSRSTHSRNLFQLCLGDPICQEIIFCRGEDVSLSLRVSIFPYYEDILSVRVMFGCVFMPIDS